MDEMTWEEAKAAAKRERERFMAKVEKQAAEIADTLTAQMRAADLLQEHESVEFVVQGGIRVTPARLFAERTGAHVIRDMPWVDKE